MVGKKLKSVGGGGWWQWRKTSELWWWWESNRTVEQSKKGRRKVKIVIRDRKSSLALVLIKYASRISEPELV